MNKNTEALSVYDTLKLALEALRDYRRSDDDRVSVAMGILQEALAHAPTEREQPAQGCNYCNHPLYAGTSCKNCGRVTEQTAQKQEPVAWDNCRSEKQCRSWCGNSACASHWNDTSPPYEATPLASQRSVKPWVGLTKADKKEIERVAVYVDGAIRLTEAKLREKNA